MHKEKCTFCVSAYASKPAPMTTFHCQKKNTLRKQKMKDLTEYNKQAPKVANKIFFAPSNWLNQEQSHKQSIMEKWTLKAAQINP